MKEYLPIGTVVTVKDIEKKVMIVGISQVRETDVLERWDYVAVLYPTGVYAENSFCFFDNDDITEIVFKGYDDEERHAFLKIVDEAEKMVNEAEKTAEEKKKNSAQSAFE